MNSVRLISLFLGAAIGSQAQAQTPETNGGRRCDAFVAALTTDLCASSVTLSYGNAYSTESYTYRHFSMFFGSASFRLRQIRPSNSYGVQWTPNEWLRIGLGLTQSDTRTSRIDQMGLNRFYQTEDQFSRSIDIKAKLLQGSLWRGEHRVFLLASASFRSSYVLNGFQQLPLGVFPGIIRLAPQTISESRRFDVGIQSSHHWQIASSGFSLVSSNQAGVYKLSERPKKYNVGFETRLMLAHNTLGVALGPAFKANTGEIDPERSRPYVFAGLAAYLQPFRNSGIAGLQGFVLDGSLYWLTSRHTDKSTLIFPFPPTYSPPERRIMSATFRARYTLEY